MPDLRPAADAPPFRLGAEHCGFNLMEKFKAGPLASAYREEDFAGIAHWGFRFVRLPLSYRCWSDPTDWRRLDEPVLRELDDAVSWGSHYGLHVSLNLHRAPGYSVSRSATEPFNLWTDDEPLRACVYHWRHLAERYRNVPPDVLSFDLLNEPARHAPGDPRLVTAKDYDRVLDALIVAIRQVSPARPLIVEGGLWGALPLTWRRDPAITQSLHLYAPMPVTHWRAEFLDPLPDWPEPRWPLPPDTQASLAARNAQVAEFYGGHPIPSSALDETTVTGWDRQRLRRRLAPWSALAGGGVPVHAGEFGVYRHTPHAVALAWLQDALSLFQENRWGWALWQWRGPFGVLDSERADAPYETWRGHSLDRRMLELLRHHLPAR